MTELDFLIEQLGEAIDNDDKPMFEYWSQLIDNHIGDTE